jgi:predicted nucleic acid-binding protein
VSAIVIDASVAVKWFFPEIHAAAAQRVLKGRRPLLAPDLIWAEVGNALWKRFQRGEVTREAAQGILRDFRQFPLQTHPAKTLLEPAWALAAQYHITVYDSLYLALALGRNCKLVTADRSFVDAIKNQPLTSTVVWIEHLRSS